MKSLKNLLYSVVAISTAFVAGSMLALIINHKNAVNLDTDIKPSTEPQDKLDIQSHSLMADTAITADNSIGLNTIDDPSDNGSVDQAKIDAYVEKHSVTKDEAKSRLQREDELVNKMYEIIEAEGTQIAGWGIRHTPEYQGWILLVETSIVSRRTQTILDENSDIEIHYSAAHSLVELEQEMDKFLPLEDDTQLEIDLLPPELRKSIVYTNIDMEKNEVIVTINHETPELQQLASSADDALIYTQSYFASVSSVPVRVMLSSAIDHN